MLKSIIHLTCASDAIRQVHGLLKYDIDLRIELELKIIINSGNVLPCS